MADTTPEGFPPLTLTVMRALCAITVLYPGNEGQEILIKLLDELLNAFWVEHKKVYEKDVLVEVLEQVIGSEETGKGWFLLIFLFVVVG